MFDLFIPGAETIWFTRGLASIMIHIRSIQDAVKSQRNGGTCDPFFDFQNRINIEAALLVRPVTAWHKKYMQTQAAKTKAVKQSE